MFTKEDEKATPTTQADESEEDQMGEVPCTEASTQSSTSSERETQRETENETPNTSSDHAKPTEVEHSSREPEGKTTQPGRNADTNQNNEKQQLDSNDPNRPRQPPNKDGTKNKKGGVKKGG